MGCFKHLHIACTGTLEAKPEQLKRWIENNDGRWMPRVGKGITHLIASKEAWKKGMREVRAAAQLGAKIVTYDWLEDSTHAKCKLAERKYLWSTIDKEKRKRRRYKKVAEKYDRAKFAREMEQARQDLGTSESPCSSSSNRSRKRNVTEGGFFRSSLSALRAERERRESGDKPETQGVVEEERVGEWKKLEDYENNGEMGDGDKQEMDVDNVAPEGDEEMEENEGEEDERAVKRDINEDSDLETTSDADEDADKDKHPPVKQKSCTPPPSPSRSPSPPSSPAPTSTPLPKEPALPTPPHSTTPSQAQPRASPPPPPQPAPPAPPKAERLTESHHIYGDLSGFKYDLQLLRTNFHRNTITKYRLRLYESNVLPHTYATFVQYQPASGTPAPPGTTTTTTTGTTPSNTLAPGTPSSAQTQAQAPPHPSLLAALSTITAPPSPSPSSPPPPHLPYRTVLAPIGSDYATAFAAFTSAFAELTLLAWEERCAPQSQCRALQKERARAVRREPFVWGNRPAPGLSVGVLGPRCGEVVRWGLPGMEAGLEREGVFGKEILREEGREREEEERREREREREREGKKGKGKGKGKGKKVGEGGKGMGAVRARQVDAGRARIYRGPIGRNGMERLYKNYSMGDGRL